MCELCTSALNKIKSLFSQTMRQRASHNWFTLCTVQTLGCWCFVNIYSFMGYGHHWRRQQLLSTSRCPKLRRCLIVKHVGDLESQRRYIR